MTDHRSDEEGVDAVISGTILKSARIAAIDKATTVNPQTQEIQGMPA